MAPLTKPARRTPPCRQSIWVICLFRGNVTLVFQIKKQPFTVPLYLSLRIVLLIQRGGHHISNHFPSLFTIFCIVEFVENRPKMTRKEPILDRNRLFQVISVKPECPINRLPQQLRVSSSGLHMVIHSADSFLYYTPFDAATAYNISSGNQQ